MSEHSRKQPTTGSTGTAVVGSPPSSMTENSDSDAVSVHSVNSGVGGGGATTPAGARTSLSMLVRTISGEQQPQPQQQFFSPQTSNSSPASISTPQQRQQQPVIPPLLNASFGDSDPPANQPGGALAVFNVSGVAAAPAVAAPVGETFEDDSEDDFDTGCFGALCAVSSSSAKQKENSKNNSSGGGGGAPAILAHDSSLSHKHEFDEDEPEKASSAKNSGSEHSSGGGGAAVLSRKQNSGGSFSGMAAARIGAVKGIAASDGSPKSIIRRGSGTNNTAVVGQQQAIPQLSSVAGEQQQPSSASSWCSCDNLELAIEVLCMGFHLLVVFAVAVPAAARTDSMRIPVIVVFGISCALCFASWILALVMPHADEGTSQAPPSPIAPLRSIGRSHGGSTLLRSSTSLSSGRLPSVPQSSGRGQIYRPTLRPSHAAAAASGAAGNTNTGASAASIDDDLLSLTPTNASDRVIGGVSSTGGGGGTVLGLGSSYAEDTDSVGDVNMMMSPVAAAAAAPVPSSQQPAATTTGMKGSGIVLNNSFGSSSGAGLASQPTTTRGVVAPPATVVTTLTSGGNNGNSGSGEHHQPQHHRPNSPSANHTRTGSGQQQQQQQNQQQATRPPSAPAHSKVPAIDPALVRASSTPTVHNNNNSDSIGTPRAIVSSPVVHNALLPELRFCDKCEKYVSISSRHCRHCGVCCAGFDHHCPWINRCVGTRNHLYFASVLSTSIFVSFTGSMLAIYLIYEFFSAVDVFHLRIALTYGLDAQRMLNGTIVVSDTAQAASYACVVLLFVDAVVMIVLMSLLVFLGVFHVGLVVADWRTLDFVRWYNNTTPGSGNSGANDDGAGFGSGRMQRSTSNNNNNDNSGSGLMRNRPNQTRSGTHSSESTADANKKLIVSPVLGASNSSPGSTRPSSAASSLRLYRSDSLNSSISDPALRVGAGSASPNSTGSGHNLPAGGASSSHNRSRRSSLLHSRRPTAVPGSAEGTPDLEFLDLLPGATMMMTTMASPPSAVGEGSAGASGLPRVGMQPSASSMNTAPDVLDLELGFTTSADVHLAAAAAASIEQPQQH